MRKQATVNSILESFSKFYTPKTAGDETQGFSESSAPAAKKDDDAESLLVTPGTNTPNAVNSAGVETEASMPGVSTSIPTEELVRKEQSPSAKIAAAGSVEELIARLAGNLTKMAEAPAAEVPAVETPVAEENKVAAAISEVNVDLLAQKTAAFLKASEFGYNQARAVFATTSKTAAPTVALPEDIEARINARVTELKTAGLNDQQIYAQLQADGQADAETLTKEADVVEDTRFKLASFVEQKIAAQLQAGTISSQQAEILLTDLGYETNTTKLAGIEAAVDQKVAYLRQTYPDITDEQIMGVLQKDAEADAAAMAQELPPEAAEGLPPEAAAAGAVPPGAEGMSPEGAPAGGEGDMAADLQQAISELQQAVAEGKMTEEQALQLLEEAGLDVQGMLAAAADQGGGDPAAQGGMPPEGAPAGGPPPEVAAEAPAEEAPKEESAEKKEAALNTLIIAADNAYKVGSLSKAQADAMIASLKA